MTPAFLPSQDRKRAMLSNEDAIIATVLVGDSPLLYDTSTLGANGSPYSISSAMPPTSTRRYSYIPTTSTSKPTIKDGWVVSASSSSKRPNSKPVSSLPATTTQAVVFTPKPPPLMKSKAQHMSSLYIAIIVLVVVVAVVAAVLVWFTWLRRRKKAGEQSEGTGEDERRPAPATEKPMPREPELSWMSGPTLIPEKDPHWSARTLVSPHGGHPQRAFTATERGLPRETSATAPPPIPPRSISRRQVSSTARHRELPLPPAPFTPLVTPVSPISPARRDRQVVDEDEILPVVNDDSYRPSPVSPLENEGFSRRRPAK